MPALQQQQQVDEASWVGVVLLCFARHPTVVCVRRDNCRRITPEELEWLLGLWMRRGEPPVAGTSLGKPLRPAQLGADWAAGLAYALAFAKLSGRLVPLELPIANDRHVPRFSSAQLENPWGLEPPQDLLQRVPPITPCERVRGRRGRKEGSTGGGGCPGRA